MPSTVEVRTAANMAFRFSRQGGIQSDATSLAAGNISMVPFNYLLFDFLLKVPTKLNGKAGFWFNSNTMG